MGQEKDKQQKTHINCQSDVCGCHLSQLCWALNCHACTLIFNLANSLILRQSFLFMSAFNCTFGFCRNFWCSAVGPKRERTMTTIQDTTLSILNSAK